MQLRKVWKESATLIVLSPSAQPSTDCHFDYNVLTVNGTALDNMNVDSHVLPGGTLDSTDFSYEWWLLFERFGISADTLCRRLNCTAPRRPPIISDNITLEDLKRWADDEDSLVCTDIALRLTAIRHLFGQTGILLAQPLSRSQPQPDSTDLQDWRPLVAESPKKFLEMCQRFGLMPDLSSLYEWWNWLTPAGVGRYDRFDSIYYICRVDELVVNPSQHWWSPKQLLDGQKSGHYFLSPPQTYEFTRLLNFKTLADISQFSKKRQTLGTDRWIPFLAMYADGTVAVLPGDDLYPANVELVASKPVRTYPQTIAEIRRKSHHWNRLEMRGSVCEVVVNIDLSLGHFRPVLQHSIAHLDCAKL